MKRLTPINHHSQKFSKNEQLTSAEMGKLWSVYMGNSMTNRILSYYLQHVDDADIKRLLENALNLTYEFLNSIKKIFERENFPVPIGFTDEDVNLSAPRLFEDEFYVHYLKYMGKAGLSIYNVALPLVFKEDVKDFFYHSIQATIELMEQIKEILMDKGLIIKPPVIPVPKKVDFVKEDFLNGFFGHVRPLHSLEIAHLYDNIENNATSKALIIGFSQVVKMEKIRKLFLRGADITNNSIERYQHQLNSANLPSPTLLDNLVTSSTSSPFSDKIMLFHKVDMFSMKIRAFGNSMAVNGRHDIGLMYTRVLMNTAAFVEDATKLLIENGWMEQVPEALDRANLAE